MIVEYLYHGSVVQGLKILEPNKRYTPSSEIEYGAVYATPLPAFAAAHAFPWSSDEGFDIEVVNNKVEVIAPASSEGRLDVPISIYKLPVNQFQITKEESTGMTWHSTEPVGVLEEMRYESVKVALEALGATLRIR